MEKQGKHIVTIKEHVGVVLSSGRIENERIYNYDENFKELPCEAY